MLDKLITDAQRDFRVLEEMTQELSADDPRDRLSIKAADYAVELASGLVVLVESGHSAAAAAISRPIIESALTSLYFLYCSPLDWAVAIERGDGYLPKYSRMMAACSKLPDVGKQLKGIDITPFHQLTHGDAMQLNRRLTGGPAFDAHVQAMQVILAHILALAAMQSAVVAGGKGHLQGVLHTLRARVVSASAGEASLPDDTQVVWLPKPSR